MKIPSHFLNKTPLAEGGEAFIYEYDDAHVLKIFKDHIDLDEKESKVSKLINKKLPNNVIKPLEIVTNDKNKFIGYVMKKINGEEFKKLSNKKFIKINKINVNDISLLLINIKNTIKELHKLDIFIGDLNDSNLLFNNKEVYFIDVDSWSIEDLPCNVCMETFKDPLLKHNLFNKQTDSFAFSILAFKTFTRLHPFGGITKPEMEITDRIKNKLSVIDNKNVKIPRTVGNWKFLSPELISLFKEIFESDKRNLIDSDLDNFQKELSFCKNHNNYFYSKFNSCPVCNESAKVNSQPTKVNTNSTIPLIKIFSNENLQTLLSFDSYVNNKNQVVHRKSNNTFDLGSNKKIYFSNCGEFIYEVFENLIQIHHNNDMSTFNKTFNSDVIVRDKKLYFVSPNLSLLELTVSNKGNYTRTITKVAFNSYFQVEDINHYFVLNIYDNMTIFNINGYSTTSNIPISICDAKIYYDKKKDKWLFIAEGKNGKYHTAIFSNDKILFQEDSFKYNGNLKNICFDNEIIFKAGDGFIRGYNYKTNHYKDFLCNEINEETELFRKVNKFIAINEKEIYKIG